jgi:DNA-binding NarL/FixJ family response regulator
MRPPGLPPKRTRVLARILLGKSPREIADEMGVGLSTVKHHIQLINKDLGIKGTRGHFTTRSLFALAVREGWLVQGPKRTLRLTFPHDEARDAA